MLDQALRSAKRSRAREQLDPRDYPHRGVEAAFHSDRHHATEARHLLLGYGVPSVALQAGIMDLRERRIAFQSGSNSHSILAMDAHAAGEGADPAHHQPRIERRRDSTHDMARVL